MLEREVDLNQASSRLQLEGNISAQSVFEQLIRAFKLPLPLLITDPVRFLNEQIRKSLFKDDSGPDEGDIYMLSSVLRRLENAGVADGHYVSGQKMERVTNALRQSEYGDGIRKATELKNAELDALQLEKLADMTCYAAAALNDNSSLEVDGYDLAAFLCERALQTDTYHRDALDTIKSRALMMKGYTLLIRKEYAPAGDVCDALIREFSGSDDRAAQLNVAFALTIKGQCLDGEGQYEVAVAEYRKVIRDFGGYSDPEFQSQVSFAITFLFGDLSKLKWSEEVLKECDELLDRFGTTQNPEMVKALSIATNNKAFALDALDRTGEAAAAFQETIERFDRCASRNVQEDVGWAMAMRASLLEAGNPQAAISLYEGAIPRLKPMEGERGSYALSLSRRRLRALRRRG